MITADQIKQRLTVRDYMQHYSIPPSSQVGEWWEYDHPPYRPESDSGAFRASEAAFCDHVTDQKGDVLELAQIHHGCDFAEAVTICADICGAVPDEAPKQSKPREVCTYNYCDAYGDMIYQVVRYGTEDIPAAATRYERMGVEPSGRDTRAVPPARPSSNRNRL